MIKTLLEYTHMHLVFLRSKISFFIQILPSRLECNITKYMLTLMSSYVQNTLTETYNISSSSDNSYVIKDLIPGYEYDITITPFTAVGALRTSSIYKATPKFTGINHTYI